MVKIKSRPPPSSSKIKISGKGQVIALLLLNIVIIIVLAPKYKRLLDASQEEPSSSTHTPAVVFHRHQQHDQERQQLLKKPPPPNRHLRDPPPISRSDDDGLPYIGEHQFNQKYSSKYKALLPSSPPRRKSPDPSCGKRPDFFDFFMLPKTERSRFHEDKIIYDLFKNTTIPSSPNEESPLPKGTYVELGAFDGKDESNTMFFDKCLGWDGLLIEAQSQSYQQVIKHRPQAVKMSFSPTCKNEGDTAKFYDYPLSNNGMEGLAKSYTGKETIEVPCGPLTPVLHDVFGPDGKVSFFSLDVEGAELKVLETIDFNVLSIEVIMVEIQNTYCPEANCPSVLNIRKHMAMTGKYALFVNFLEASDVYVLHGTVAWRKAVDIQRARKEQMEREIRDQMMLERQQLIG
ncbi:hypothetical protein ACHAXR_006468 [Thalassiosira sp. AJA248-18]